MVIRFLGTRVSPLRPSVNAGTSGHHVLLDLMTEDVPAADEGTISCGRNRDRPDLASFFSFPHRLRGPWMIWTPPVC